MDYRDFVGRPSWEIQRYLDRYRPPPIGSFVTHEGWNPSDWGEVVGLEDGKVLVCCLDKVVSISPHCINFPRLEEPPRDADRIFAMKDGQSCVYKRTPWSSDCTSTYTAWSLVGIQDLMDQ